VARLIWTGSALDDLDDAAEYIALDNPAAARSLVERVFRRVDQLARFPKSGKRPAELFSTPYREVVVPPCRIFYRVDGHGVHPARDEGRAPADQISPGGVRAVEIVRSEGRPR